MREKIYSRISRELGIPLSAVTGTASLLDDGNTVPFIARYRKEATGGLSDEQVRLIEEKAKQYGNLEQRRETVARLLEGLGVLNADLKKALNLAGTVTEIEDLYRPFRPRKKTRASQARELGLEPLARAILEGKIDPVNGAANYLDQEKGPPDEDSALQGARDIIAEIIADDPGLRKGLRLLYWKMGQVVTEKNAGAGDGTYDQYDQYREALAKIKGHRVLAITRGAREKVLSSKIAAPADEALALVEKMYLRPEQNDACRASIKSAAADSFKRLLHPAMERESWQALLEKAVAGAMLVFRENLKKRLLVPPIGRRRVMGWDPGYRTGCKLACVSETGELLETAAVYPTAPLKDENGAAEKVLELLSRHRVDCIAIGNGTASRESESFIAALIREKKLNLEYTIVNEAGASVYSASKTAQKEFPALDAAERGAVSIARRLQDPLAELVKIEPRAIGVGQYQHDMPAKELDRTLAGVVESCVNAVGVDLNSASAALFAYVAGINATVAEKIVALRSDRGVFSRRSELLDVPGLGPKVFQQCAGFTRLPASEDYLERSAIHPEAYELARRTMEALDLAPDSLGRPSAVPELEDHQLKALAASLEAGEPTIKDILEEFRKPGRDPREGLAPPVFQQEITKLEDLQPGMNLQGVVRNILDFGIFVDIGVHRDGLVHISEIADRYIKHPLEVVQMEEVVLVKILSIDGERGRIALSMKQADPAAR